MLDAMRRGLTREASGDALLPDSSRFIGGAWATYRSMEQAPVIIFVMNLLGAVLTRPLSAEDRVYEICNAQSIGAAVENMTLEAVRLGLGSLWICDIFFAYRELCSWLNTEGTLFAALALGVADEQPPPRPRKDINEAVEWRG